MLFLMCRLIDFRAAAKDSTGAPSIDLVKIGFGPGIRPGNASSEVREAMEFFLGSVVECASKQVKCPTRWADAGESHIGFFGNTWMYEMATASILLQHFSDTTNIAHNIAGPSERKKKKRMMSKDNEGEICRDYYNHVRFFAGLKDSDSNLVERMKEWDDHCLAGTRSSGTQTATLTNVIPLERRGNQVVNNDCGMEGLGFESILGMDFEVEVNTPTAV